MSNRHNRFLSPEAKARLDQLKIESAREIGVDLKEGYAGNLTSKEAGYMVKKMVKAYEQGLK